MNFASPEKKGLSCAHIYDFISSLNKRGLRMHSVLMMRGEDIIYEGYWKPFDKDFNHRMYSVTKSFVSVAIGLLEEDGLISLHHKIADYFPDKITYPLCENLKNQTIKEMLTMTTTGLHRSWFDAGDPDRTHLYFSDCGKRRPSGTVWEYDSAGSQVLCALVERVSKKSLFDFLNERIFTHLGTFKNARILKTPNGDSWGDSAMICTPRDLASFARFVMSYGVHKGKRLMNENYLKTATSPVVNNKSDGFEHMMYHGYGYQFWITEEEGFAFVGMGDQLAICVPKYDFIFVCTADNQGNEISRDYIVSRLFDYIISNLSSSPLCESRESSDRLSQLTNSLALYSARESNDSPMRKDINERTYIFEENPMSLEKICFRFDTQSEGKLIYTRDGREMELEFYVNKNRFGLFPELSYSDQVGGVKTQNGHKYKDAVSFTWLQDNKILVLIQIIDNYFGNASLVFSFKDDYVVAQFSKTAEDFLHGYCGTAIGKAE